MSMDKFPASIFNDVLGPVMRGPSSSHVAGAGRIGELVRQSMKGKIRKAVVDFDINGSLAASHTGHGTDMGLTCGLMGIQLSASNVDQYKQLAREQQLEIQYRILDYGAKHPGNYRMEVTDQYGNRRCFEAIALGGGMIEMQKIDDFDVNIQGDFYELLTVCDISEVSAETYIENITMQTGSYNVQQRSICKRKKQMLLNLKFTASVSEKTIADMKKIAGVLDVIYLTPVLPTLSDVEGKVPYSTAGELLAFANKHPMEPWEYGAYYECCRGNISMEQVEEKMDDLLQVMEEAVDRGLKGTVYKDRILGAQAYKIKEAQKRGELIPCDVLNEIIQCITAIMEMKSSMGLIVAAPTCGSCGCLPGTVIGLGRALSLSREELRKGLFMAGLIGIFFAEQATFSAEVGGCQVECGAGSGMAAAAITQMMGGTIEQCLDAASMALQNITGLACDPVGNRVEVPCLGKNIMGGSNALSSANMILAGFDKVIPLDETIQAIYDIGLQLPLELRCTFGGLGKTKTARRILEKMEKH